MELVSWLTLTSYIMTFLYAVIAGALGFFVGAAELLNRYKTFKTVFNNSYAWVYMIINLIAAIITYAIMHVYDIKIGTLGSQEIGGSLVAGLGAMAFLRSSFFSFKDSNDKTIEVGPAAILRSC